jgi:tetratricopeptide (TPR) repeat protein
MEIGLKIASYSVVLALLVLAALAHQPAPRGLSYAVDAAARPEMTPPDIGDETVRFAAARAAVTAIERAAALERFIVDFPESKELNRAKELLTVTRAAIGDSLLAAGETADGLAMFRRAVAEAPLPLPARLFEEVISKIPPDLFDRGHRAEALEIAALAEALADGDLRRLALLADFHLAVEDSAGALRIARAMVSLDPASVHVHQTLGHAYRLNFDLLEAERAFAKALELDPSSVQAKRSLAEMKRANGKPGEALTLFREILAANENDLPSETGAALCLLELGKTTEAEDALDAALIRNPGNVVLLASSAYWYAARGQAEEAYELAADAIKRDPRYIWSHIALGRSLMLQNKYAEAEIELIKARQYGNFPTLEYEIATARLMAGYYRDAADELRKNFSAGAGQVEARLGGRVPRSGPDLEGLLAYEVRASFFNSEFAAAGGDPARLRALLELDSALGRHVIDETEAARAAEAFAAGSDKMRLHRQLYAANALLEKKAALPKVLALTKAAVSSVDDGLAIESPTGPVMASELYDARRVAFLRGQFVAFPEVPRPTLSAIVRGRIEEITGAAYFEQEDHAEAVVRLRRAVSVLPKDSAWWRSSMWRLGSALEATGKETEALDSFISSYLSGEPSGAKYIVIESLYRRVNGNTDDLELKIGPNPAARFVAVDPVKTDRGTEVTPPDTERAVAEPDKDVPETVKPAAEPSPAAEMPAIGKDEKPLLPEVPTEPREKVLDPDPPAAAKTADVPPAAAKTDDVPPAAEKEKAAEPVPENRVDEPAEPPKPAADTAVPTGDAPVRGTDAAKRPDASLFDPVVITVPGPRSRTVAVPPAAAQIDAEVRSDAKADEVSAPSDTETAGRSIDRVNLRPRVVLGNEITEVPATCSINVSQEKVSLSADGGNIGILAGTGKPDVSVSARSSSPEDVEVAAEPEIEGITGRTFFVIRSVSKRVGVYQVWFEAPCGKKEVLVRVQ